MLRWAASSCVTLVLLAASAGTAHRALGCSAPQEMTRFKVKLPNTARAVRSGKPLVIVAIGSSSTVGVGASDPAHTYPALLAEELQASLASDRGKRDQQGRRRRVVLPDAGAL